MLLAWPGSEPHAHSPGKLGSLLLKWKMSVVAIRFWGRCAADNQFVHHASKYMPFESSAALS